MRRIAVVPDIGNDVDRTKEQLLENLECLLTAQDVARVLAVSPKTVYKLAKTKRLNPITIGKSVRFRPEDVAEIRRGQRNL